MWKKAFFRLLFVIGIVAAGMLYGAGAGQNPEAAYEGCPESKEKCCKNQEENSTLGDFNFWESFSRIVSVSM